MRTTITLDDRLLDRLKKGTAESGTSVAGKFQRICEKVWQMSVPLSALPGANGIRLWRTTLPACHGSRRLRGG